MNLFCKIILHNNRQVLITKDTSDDDVPQITQTCDLEAVRPSIALGFSSEEKRDAAFNDYSEGDAARFLENIDKICESFIEQDN